MLDTITGLVDAQRAFVLEVVGEALGEFRNEFVDEANAAFAEMPKQLAELRKARGDDANGDKVIALPNPIASRLQ